VLVAALAVYLVVSPQIDDGSLLELLFAVVTLGIVVVTFPWHRISLEKIGQSTPLLLSLLLVFLVGAGISVFVLDQGILAEAVMLVAVFCGLLAAFAKG